MSILQSLSPIPHLLSPMTRTGAAELMDAPGLDPVELAANFRDIRRVNALFGGTRVVLRHLPALLAGIPSERPVTVLDLATGSADIPLTILRWAAKRGRTLEITASDVSDEMLAIADAHLRGEPGIALAQHDARAVPLPAGAFDLVLCSLALHHFAPAEAMLVLAEMRRLARLGAIVNDLARSRTGYAAAWLAAQITTRNRLTRHDAPLSVKRAYTPDELRELLRQAGIDHARVTTHPMFRMAAVWRTAGVG